MKPEKSEKAALRALWLGMLCAKREQLRPSGLDDLPHDGDYDYLDDALEAEGIDLKCPDTGDLYFDALHDIFTASYQCQMINEQGGG